jgi:hypothetical protein
MDDRGARLRALRKAERLNDIMEARFGLRIDFDSASTPHLSEVCRLYDERRAMMLDRLGEARAFRQPDYAKAVLVSEAIRMFLREIAPRRSKKNRK